MNPTAVRRALYAKLAGDGGTGGLVYHEGQQDGLLAAAAPGFAHSIYYGHAPDSAHYPFVVFNKQAGTPTYANATKPAFETDVWLFKAVDHNSTADAAEAISSRLQTLLNDAGLSIAGVVEYPTGSGNRHEMWLRRDSDIDYQEVADGETYVHSGSLYRLVVEPA